MMRPLLLILCCVLLATSVAHGFLSPSTLTDEYSSVSASAPADSGAPGLTGSALPVKLTLDELYRPSETFATVEPIIQPPAAAGQPPSESAPPRVMPIAEHLQSLLEAYPVLYPLGLLVLLFALLLVTGRLLSFSIRRSLKRIPWEGVREDPLVQAWAQAGFFRKFHLNGYLADLRRLAAIIESKENQGYTRNRNKSYHRLCAKYRDQLKTVSRVDEVKFIMGALTVVGNVNVVTPVLECRDRFRDHAEVNEWTALVLLSIRDAKILRSFLPYISDADPALQDTLRRVCRSFGDLGLNILVKELYRLENAEPAIKFGLLHLLGELGGEKIVPVIEKFLFQGSEQDCMAAAEAIARTGSEAAVRPLIEGLCQSPSSRVRARIAECLRQVPADLALSELNKIVKLSPTHYFRIRAIEGLAALNPDPCPTLYTALWDEHPKVEAAAAQALVKIGVVEERLGPYLHDFDEDTGSFLTQVGKAGGIKPFLGYLKTADPKSLKRLARLLARIGNADAVPRLIDLLESTEDWTVQSRLIPALADLKATEAIPLILRHLKSPHHWVRKTSIDAMGKLLTTNSSQFAKSLPLLHEALDDENPWTRASAVRVLTYLQDKTCIPKLMELLDDPQTRVRYESIQALKEFYAVQAEGRLLEMLDDTRQKVRSMAASALGQFRSHRALPKFLERFDKAGSMFRLAIIEAVYRVEPAELPSLIPFLNGANRRNLKVVRGLKEMDSCEPKRILVPLAKKADTEIRCEAIRGLANQEGSEIEELLKSFVRDSDAAVRGAAVDAIALSENGTMSELLSELRDDPEEAVRMRVILALGLIKNPDTLTFLRNSLYYEKEARVRAYAMLALFHYAEPRFLEYFLEQFRDREVRNLLKGIIADRSDPVCALLIDRIPHGRHDELNILRNHTMQSLDEHLAEQISGSRNKEDKFKAIMIAEFLRRGELKTVLQDAAIEDPLPEIRARALRAFSEIADVSEERALIQQALLDPSLEVQTIASRLLIHLNEETAEPIPTQDESAG